MEQAKQRKCVLCGAILEGVAEDAAGELRCGRCGATGRYDAENLVAIFIPNYFAQLLELQSRNKELTGEIELEGMKGEYRDMRYLQRKHLERQDVLAEYAFLSHFRDLVEKW
jgi:ribosomal protein S27AE